jgi:hypothetical protein
MNRLMSVGLLLVVSASLQASPLQGTWQLVSARYTTKDGKTIDATKDRSTKILSGSHFAFVTTKTDGTFIRAATGTFTVSGNKYSEHVVDTSGAPKPGVYTFTYTVKGDEWRNEGDLHDGHLVETWRRVK